MITLMRPWPALAFIWENDRYLENNGILFVLYFYVDTSGELLQGHWLSAALGFRHERTKTKLKQREYKHYGKIFLSFNRIKNESYMYVAGDDI